MEQLKVYDSPEEFWREVSPHLLQEEAKNCLGVGLAKMFVSHPEGRLLQLALFEDEKLSAAAMISRYITNLNLIPFPLRDPDKARRILGGVKDSGIDFNNLIAEKETAQIYRSLLEQDGYRFELHMKQGIYRCRTVKMPEAKGTWKFRVAGLDDISLVAEWMEDFQNECTPHDPKFDYIKMATEKIGKGMIFLLEDGMQQVSMAGRSRDTATSSAVNLVFTPKSLRGNGYASFVTAKLTQHLLDQGKRETNLFTDMSNPTSNKIYQNIGYEFVCDSVHLGVQR